MQLDDKELLHQFRQSETKERAFTAIIKKYQEKLYWHIRRMVIDHEDANDVLQNMFIKVWKNLENFKEESQLYTWLYRIATNESLTFLEQQKKRASVSLSDVETNFLDFICQIRHFNRINIHLLTFRALVHFNHTLTQNNDDKSIYIISTIT